MSFILSKSRDSDFYDKDLFVKYFDYLYSVKNYFPESAWEVAVTPSWYSIEEGGPHDLSLLRVCVEDHISSNEDEENFCNISIFLVGAVEMVLRYRGVVEYNMSMITEDSDVHGYWRYDEFLLDGPFVFKHTIEWGDGAVWSIRAKDLVVEK